MGGTALLTTTPEPAAERSIEPGRPRWTWWPEALVVVGGAFIFFAWSLDQNGWGNDFYAAAVRSMSRSWSNFFYGSLDPGGWITVDKPPGALWLQALSARLFGYSSWSILLPSAVCAAVAVGVLMATVRRPWGRGAGLVAGVVLATTPIVVAVSRSNNPDATLMLLVVVAAWAAQRGIGDGRVRWMLLVGVVCGLGFLTKLLTVGLVMPGLFVAYLVAAPRSWRDRLVHLALSAGVFVVVMLSWVVAVDLRPLADRPWVGGSTAGSPWDFVFGYNGFGRFTGASYGPGMGTNISAGQGGTGTIDQFGGEPGLFRLFNAGMGDQVMWLFPVALVSGIAGLISSLRRRVRGPRLGSLVLWVGWLFVVGISFSFVSGVFHNYYTAELAPALAALVGIGVAQFRESARPGRLVAGAALVATAVTQVILLDRVDAWTWLRIVVPAVVAVGVVVGVIALLRGATGNAWTVAPFAVAAVALCAAPAAWSLAGVEHVQQGTFPDARPVAAGGFGPGSFPGSFPGSGAPGGGAPGGGAPGGGAPGGGAPGGGPGARGLGGSLSADELAWLRSERHGERWILGVSSSMEAAAPIIAGEDVVALGGFSGLDLAATPVRVARLVHDRELRFLSLGGGIGVGGGGGLSSAVAAACTPVDAAAWGATGTSGVYDCKGKADAIRKAAKSAPATPNATVPGGGPPTAAPGGGVPGGLDVEKIQACFARNGVHLKPNEAPSFSDPKVLAALQACRDLLPAGAGPAPNGGGPPP
jgi:4-amino-4-deoxy-L-arabinose transferase-like glycosyltransferase